MLPFYVNPIDPKNFSINENISQKTELVRILMQTLENLGFDESAGILSTEAGISLENDLTLQFKKDILCGSWEKSLEKIEMMNLPKETLESIAFMIYEQKYLECIEIGNIDEAVILLRTDLKKTCKDTQKLHKLASLVMCKNSEYLSKKVNWEGNLQKKRKKLLSNIKKMNKSINMMETDIMDRVLKQALCYQILSCKYHSKLPENYSLLQEHKCNQEKIPNKCFKTLNENKDEVWLIKFSNAGNKLASISKNCSLILWDFNLQTFEINRKLPKKDNIHGKEIHCLLWSYDDTKILTASADHNVKIWDSNNLDVIHTLKGHTEIVCGAAWHPFDGRLFTGGIDNYISVWQDDKNQIEKIKTNRLSDMIIAPNGKYLYTISASFYRVSVIDLKNYNEINKIIEKDIVISAEITKDGKFLLINTSFKYPELHKWDLETFELVQIFSGHVQEKFMLRCSCGGCLNTLISCGSEDGKIYLWHKNSKDPVGILEGHTMTINSVSWNPQNPYILASASDDHSIKLWGNSEILSSMASLNEMEEEKEEDNSMNLENGGERDQTILELPHLFEDETI